MVLVGLWLLSQMSPETLFFGAGDLRELFQPPPGKLYPPEVFLRVEAAIAAANTIAIGLSVSCLTRRAGPARLLFCALVAVALALRWTAFDVLMKDMLWITPGALTGLAAGVLMVLAGISLPRTARLAVAGLALMGATALVNLSPGNPYMAASLALWQRGVYFNFNGLTHIVSAVWPFAAMFYLVFLAADRGRGIRPSSACACAQPLRVPGSTRAHRREAALRRAAPSSRKGATQRPPNARPIRPPPASAARPIPRAYGWRRAMPSRPRRPTFASRQAPRAAGSCARGSTTWRSSIRGRLDLLAAHQRDFALIAQAGHRAGERHAGHAAADDLTGMQHHLAGLPRELRHRRRTDCRTGSRKMSFS